MRLHCTKNGACYSASADAFNCEKKDCPSNNLCGSLMRIDILSVQWATDDYWYHKLRKRECRL